MLFTVRTTIASILVVLAAAGCGRIRFDAGDGAMDGGHEVGPVDSGPDAPMDSGAGDSSVLDVGPEDTATGGEDGGPDSGTAVGYEFASATLVGSDGSDRCFSLGMNANGAHAITGKFQGTVDLGEGPVTSAGADDMFVILYEPEGTVRWARHYGGLSTDGGNDIDVDLEGRVFVAGEFRNNLDLGGGGLPNAGDLDLFVGALDDMGGHVWSRSGGSSIGELGHAVGYDAIGGGALGGYVRGPGTFDAIATGHSGGRDAVIARYSPDGAIRWAEAWGGAGDEEVRGVVIDSVGRVVVAGFHESAFDVEVPAPTPVEGPRDGFVFSIDDTGGSLWVTTITGPGSEEILGIAVDGFNDLYVVGSYESGATFGGVPLPPAAGQNGFVASLDDAGNVRWVTATGGSGSEVLHGVAVRGERVFATGYFDSGFELGPLTAVTEGRDSAWAALGAADGTPLFATPMLGVTALGIGASSRGLVVVSGYFSGTADFGGGPMPEAGGGDAFVARWVAVGD